MAALRHLHIRSPLVRTSGPIRTNQVVTTKISRRLTSSSKDTSLLKNWGLLLTLVNHVSHPIRTFFEAPILQHLPFRSFEGPMGTLLFNCVSLKIQKFLHTLMRGVSIFVTLVT